MEFYKCKVRLKGDVRNEVRKAEVSAPEVLILRKIHGDDAVVAIESLGNRKVKDADERDRLQHAYAGGLGNAKTSMVQLFGEYAPLPKTLPETDEGEDIEVETKSAGKKKPARGGRKDAEMFA